MHVIDTSGLPPAKKQGPLSRLMVPRPVEMICPARPRQRSRRRAVRLLHADQREPPSIAVTIGAQRRDTPELKDAWRNIERTAEFVANVEIAEHIEAVAREYPPRHRREGHRRPATRALTGRGHAGAGRQPRPPGVPQHLLPGRTHRARGGRPHHP